MQQTLRQVYIDWVPTKLSEEKQLKSINNPWNVLWEQPLSCHQLKSSVMRIKELEFINWENKSVKEDLQKFFNVMILKEIVMQ